MKINPLIAFAVLAAASACSRESGPDGLKEQPAAKIGRDEMELLWHDEFDGNTLDTLKWNHRDLGERRDAVNVREAVSVRNGKLYLNTFNDTLAVGKARYYTGMISTEGRLDISKGYFEARIRFAGKPGMWSAFWLQTPAYGRGSGNPEESGVEIDIVEHRMHDQDGKNIRNLVSSALHFGFDIESRTFSRQMKGVTRGYHLYGVNWDDSGYAFYFDGRLLYFAGSDEGVAVSDALQYIILSSEVKDNGWAGKIPAKGFGTLEEDRTRMIVDWVRVYKPKPRK